jgi:hypothetical protein
MSKLYFQGDMLIEQVADNPKPAAKQIVKPDPDGSAVIGRGEVTGHRHRFALEDKVTLFRDDALARNVPDTLYVGHIKVGAKGATLLHEEHDPIELPAGTYRIRRQREWTAEQARIVED